VIELIEHSRESFVDPSIRVLSLASCWQPLIGVLLVFEYKMHLSRRPLPVEPAHASTPTSALPGSIFIIFNCAKLNNNDYSLRSKKNATVGTCWSNYLMFGQIYSK
jgi:hypothetical protein